MGIVNSNPNEWKLITKQSQQPICRPPSNDTFQINIESTEVNVLKVTSKMLLCLSPLPRLGAYKLISGLHTQARLLGSRIKTDNQGWSKMAKGKGPKPI